MVEQRPFKALAVGSSPTQPKSNFSPVKSIFIGKIARLTTGVNSARERNNAQRIAVYSSTSGNAGCRVAQQNPAAFHSVDQFCWFRPAFEKCGVRFVSIRDTPGFSFRDQQFRRRETETPITTADVALLGIVYLASAQSREPVPLALGQQTASVLFKHYRQVVRRLLNNTGNSSIELARRNTREYEFAGHPTGKRERRFS